MPEPEQPEEEQPAEEQPDTIRVPVRPGPGPLSPDECVEVPAETAAHWDSRVWHDRPRR
jgi:hypothetical protein